MKQAMTIIISAAREDDLPALLTLLERSGLPQDGLTEHIGSALAARLIWHAGMA